MYRPITFLLLAASLAFPNFAWALNPTSSLTQYNCHSWRKDSGLPVGTIYTLAVADDGRLWLGTSQGLLNFDGIEFHSLPEDRINDRIVTTIAPRAAGGLWYGLDNGGYGFFDGKTTHPLQLPAWTTAESVVRQILETRDGSLFIASTSGIGLAKPGSSVEPVLPDTRADVFSVHEDDNGTIWIGTAEHGLYQLKNGTLTPFADPSLRTKIVEVIAHDKRGTLWVATPDEVKGYDEKMNAITVPIPAGFSPKSVFIDSHDAVWVGTYGGGVFRFQNGQLSRFTRFEGLASDDVLCFAESPDGSLWIATSDGLTQLSDLKFPTVSRHEGLAYDGALCVTASPNGGVWVGTPNGISYYKNGTCHNYGIDTSDGFGSNWIKRIFAARNGDLYLIGGRKNLDRFSGGKVVQTWKGNDWPKDVAEDDQGIIVALAGRLMRIEAGEMVPYHLKDGSTVDLGWINNLLITPDHTLWIAADSGLYAIKEGRVIDYCTINGLPKVRYDFLTTDNAGNIWAAQHHGIARCKGDKMTLITREQGLAQNYVYAMVADRQGTFWMDSDRGIFSVLEAELNAVANGQASSLVCHVYEGSDAVKSTDKVAIEYSGTLSTDGKVWFPTSKGVVAINPASIPPNPPTPRVSIIGMRVNGKSYEPDGAMELEPGDSNLEFNYVAVEYIAPKKVRYRYRLVGMDADWVAAGNRRTAYYTNVPPGHYRFEVQATNTEGMWDQSVDQATFEIPRRYYQTPFFRIACAILLIGTGLYAAWARRVHQRKKELEAANTLMEEKVRERTTELRAEIEERKRAQEETERLHGVLQASAEAAQAATKAKSQFLANMSHEIRTPMNAIVGMSNLLRETPLNTQQLELVETTHNSAEALLTILNDILDFSKIEAGKLTLEKLDFGLVEAVEESLDLLIVRAEEKKIELASFVSHELPAIVRGDPSRLRQVLINLLGNAIKFTAQGSVVVSVKPDAPSSEAHPRVRFEVRDTGIGIEADVQKRLFQPFTQADNSTTRRFGGTGLGLAISQQIVALMGGAIGIESVPGKGSTFWFTLPFEAAAEPAKAHGNRPPGPSISGLRLLILDTNPLLQEVLLHHAKAWGVSCSVAADKSEAVRLATEALSEGSPFSALILRQESQTENIPSIEVGGFPLQTMLLASLRNARTVTALPPGVIAIVPVPIRAERLRHALETVAGSTPAILKAAKAMEASVAQKKAAPSIPPDLRILVAEDNVVNQRVVQLQLRKAGFEAKIVANGVEVLKALEQGHYDLVFMDCQMPEMDGYEATRRIRQQEHTKDLYVVAMTANSLDGDRERCLAAGMSAYLSKPTREQDLLAALATAATRAKKSETPA